MKKEMTEQEIEERLKALKRLSEAAKNLTSALENFSQALDFTLNAEIVGDVLESDIISDVLNGDVKGKAK